MAKAVRYHKQGGPEVLQVDDSYRLRGPDEWVWPPGRTDHWGIAPPKAEHVKAAQAAIVYR